MSTTYALADPLTSTCALVLRVPLIELYALLWRAGIVEILEPDQASRRASGKAARVGSDPVDPDLRTAGSGRPRPLSRQWRLPGLEPTRGGRAAYSQSVG
ncbi:MAG TPA: Rv1535 domain-containing protein [Mycobacterium sp.]|nr:Rv1535 domain-containing protein [Mycobacterium sp.]